MLRKLPLFFQAENHANTWAVVGSGPSINDCVDEIKALKKRGANVVTVNKSHDWALEHGIVPWGHVLLDPKEWVADYVKRPRKDVRYFVASQCHAKTFEALEDYPVFLWHAGQDFDGDAEPFRVLREYWPKTGHAESMVGGGTTVGFRVPILGQGMRPVPADKFHMFGVDSSRAKSGEMHGVEKPEPPDAETGTLSIKHNGRKYNFDTNTHMARQLFDFDKLIAERSEYIKTRRLRPEFSLTIHGTGLLPFAAAKMGLHANPDYNEDPTLLAPRQKAKAPVDFDPMPFITSMDDMKMIKFDTLEPFSL